MTPQNPLIWFIEVNGLAVDARHVPLEIQIEAFERRLIPFVPALGPDGTAAREEPRTAGPADGVALAETAHLLEHCSELKHQLVEFASSRRFSHQVGKAVREGTGGTAIDESEFANLLDRFILQQPLADGRTVVEVFVAEHPELADDDRELLLGWREVVEGVFEIRERAGDAIIATRLGDEASYRIWANAGPGALAPMRPRCFMTAWIVPAGGDWMLSGAQHIFPASQCGAMLRLAAEPATGHPPDHPHSLRLARSPLIVGLGGGSRLRAPSATRSR